MSSSDAWSILSSRRQMTLLGLMLFDVTRAADYLQQRPEVDPARIGVIGHSQGGITGAPFLAFEPGVKAAVLSGTSALLFRVLLEKTQPFDIDPESRHRLLDGLDDISLTLRHDAEIAVFEQERPAFLPVTTGISAS